jgi:hypothetical protein
VSVHRADVAFPAADGTVLRGWCLLPADASPDAPVPGVVIAHGFSAVKEMGLVALAGAFAAAGFAGPESAVARDASIAFLRRHLGG